MAVAAISVHTCKIPRNTNYESMAAGCERHWLNPGALHNCFDSVSNGGLQLEDVPVYGHWQRLRYKLRGKAIVFEHSINQVAARGIGKSANVRK